MENLMIVDEYALETKLEQIVKKSMNEYENEKRSKEGDRTYSVNQVARRLGKAHATVKKLIEQGHLPTTKSGLITERAINEYLGKV